MSVGESLQKQAEEFRARYQAVFEQIGRVIVGHDEIVHGVLDVPVRRRPLPAGRACRAWARPCWSAPWPQALDLEFNRIQFTPDLMPADILGTNMVMETPDGKRRFEFQRGPIFTQICLADEINRATPKTQSALLETMQEGTVTVGGTRYELTQPFFVMATQNPIEQEGTYPLPEAQLDRFFFKLLVGYSSREELATIIDRTTRGVQVDAAEGDGRGRDPAVAAADPRSRSWRRTCRTTSSGSAWPRTPKARSPCRSPTSTCVGAAVREGPKPWPWPPRSEPCWKDATTSALKTCDASSCRPCGTA